MSCERCLDRLHDARERIAKLEAVATAARILVDAVESGFASVRPDVARRDLVRALDALDRE